MANVQIYQLDNAGSDLDNSALLAMDIPNPDTSAASEVPYVTRKASVSELETQMLQTDEYTTALDTTNTTIIGAINEQQSVIGYSYDAYDATTAYSKGDLCIYNNTLYKAKQATTGNLPTNTTYWEITSIADEIGRITEITTGTITPDAGIDLAPSNATLETKNEVTNISISLGANGTATLARWGYTKICSLSVPPRNIQRYLSRARLGANDWFSILVQIETNGDLYIYDTFGVTAGTITGFFFSATYLS